MAPKISSSFIVTALFLISAPLLPPPASACDSCSQPAFPRPKAPTDGGGGFFPTLPTARCPLDHIKLGLCLDVLGGLVHLGAGNPAENVCCPVLHGVLELEAAVCLCTAIKLRVLNLDIYLPLALNLLVTCGKAPPPGYLCPLN